MQDVLRLCVAVGRTLLQYGAESALIRDFIERTGRLYGMDQTEISLSSSSMVATVMKGDKWLTMTAKCPDRGVDMTRVMAVEKTIILAENKKIDLPEMERRFKTLDPGRYNKWLVALCIGISCGVFAKLAGGDLVIVLMTTLASFVGRVALQELQLRTFNPVACFFLAAFACTLISSLALKFGLGNNPDIAVHSAVLLFVPGFPLVNALSDMVKGFKNMGMARWISATLVTLGTALGMIAAMSILGV